MTVLRSLLNCGYIHIWDVRAGQVAGLPQYVVIQTNYLLLCSKVELILLVIIISYICYLCQVCPAMFISQICYAEVQLNQLYSGK